MSKLSGLIAAPFTPMGEDAQIDLSKIDSYSKFLINNQVSGAFICGTTGEGPSLSAVETEEIMREWGRSKGTLSLIFMAGSTRISENIDLVAKSSSLKMDAIAILSPYYYRPGNLNDLIKYCFTIAREANGLPVYYYHIPGITGVNFQMAEFLPLAFSEIPNFAGIKYSQLNIVDFHSCLTYADGRFDLLWGTDEALLSALAIGAKGAVGSTYNYAAPLYHNLMNAFSNGNIEEAAYWQRKSVQMVQLLYKFGGISTGKAFMKIIGMDCGIPRSPLFPLTEKDIIALEKELIPIGFFDFCSQFA